MNLILNFLNESLNLWLQVSPYLLLGLFIASLLHVFLGREFIFNHLGKGGILSIIKAAVFGIPLPVCSCGVIPLADSLRKDGAHKSSVLSFLVSTPTTGVDSILATYSLMGPLFAVFRPLGAFISGILVGSLDYLFGGASVKSIAIPAHEHQKVNFRSKIREQMRYAFFEIPQDIGKWLLIGTFLGGFISAVVPQNLFSRYLAFPLDFVVVLLAAVPLYVCATGSIPIAVALLAKGFTPGAALVFLIAGPATNAITLSFVRAKLGRRSFYLYLISIIVAAIILGVVFNFIWAQMSGSPEFIVGAGKIIPHSLKIASAIALFLIIINALFRKTEKILDADLEIKVPDMHCRNCKLTLEGNIRKLDGVEKTYVDLGKKTIYINGTIEKSQVIEKIKKCGYNPERNLS